MAHNLLGGIYRVNGKIVSCAFNLFLTASFTFPASSEAVRRPGRYWTIFPGTPEYDGAHQGTAEEVKDLKIHSEGLCIQRAQNPDPGTEGGWKIQGHNLQKVRVEITLFHSGKDKSPTIIIIAVDFFFFNIFILAFLIQTKSIKSKNKISS